jgi:hypothetical protein
MAACVYCHFDGLDDKYCPKCGNPTPENRVIELGRLATGVEGKPGKRAIRTQVPLNGRVSGAAAGKKRYPFYVWLAIGLILGSGAILNAVDGGDSATTAGDSSSQSANFDPERIDADGKNMPAFIGKNAQSVRRFADNAILHPSYYDTDGVDIERTLGPKHGNGHGSWMDLLDTYFVCDQLPLPGVPLLSSNNDLRLTVSEDCEAAPVKKVAGIYAKKYHLWGPAIPVSESESQGNTFEGWVISVARTGWFDTVQVQVLTPYSEQTVELSGLSQADDPCPTKRTSSEFWNLVLQQVQTLLPTGTPVTFTYAGSRPVIITKLGVDDIEQVATPETVSVNEQLVSTGYWVPDAGDLKTTSVLDKGAKWTLWFPDTASDYEKTLVKLANQAIKTKAGPMAACKK